MQWLKQAKLDEETGLTPVAVAVQEPQTIPDDYKRLVNKLHLRTLDNLSYQTEQIKFNNFLAENGIRAYPREKVEAFLRSEVHKINVASGRAQISWQWVTIQGYTKPIPYPVLLTVEKIKDVFPTAAFYISDYVTPRPDPFLAVEHNGVFVIVEHWDEPSFLPFLNQK